MAKQQSRHFTITFHFNDSVRTDEVDMLWLRGIRDNCGNRPNYIDITCNRFDKFYTATVGTLQMVHDMPNLLSGDANSKGRIRLMPIGFHKQVYE